jgi:hypothetical protein
VRDIVIFFFHGEILVFLVQIVNFVNCLILLGLIDVKYSDTCEILKTFVENLWKNEVARIMTSKNLVFNGRMFISFRSVYKHGHHKQFLFLNSKNSSSLNPLGQMNQNLIGSIYERFCIKFPSNRLKSERHRLVNCVHRKQTQ